tara:strand:+ start:438 stop:638 length:201 start_codon:yes stop_codon:yes gene_type:complete
MERLKKFFIKRKMIPRWKLIIWSTTCALYGIYITTMEFELFDILWGLFIFLWIGWQTLFEKKSILE